MSNDQFIETQEREARSLLMAASQLSETLTGLDSRFTIRMQGIVKKLRLLTTCNDSGQLRSRLSEEVTQLERCLEAQQRDSRTALRRLDEDVSASEVRRQRASPGPGSQLVSDSLLALNRAIGDWDRYCIVRYEFLDRGGMNPVLASWQSMEPRMQEALPERLGHPVRVVSPKPGVLLAAIQCQLLEYAGQAEAMEQSLATVSGLKCLSRIVEPLSGEAMRETVARLEKAG